MKSLSKTALVGALLSSSLVFGTAVADDFSATAAKLKAAMLSDIRSEGDIARDDNRRPIKTLEFFGLRDNMRIVELIPGGGWYTKLLAPTMAEKGEYYLALGYRRAKENLLDKPGFDKVKLGNIGEFNRPEGQYFVDIELDGLGVDDVDMVLTFRNYHNLSEQGRAAMNKAAFAALKPGGIYAVVDHTRRHMEETGPSNRRRVDPVLAIKEILDAGFEFVDYTDLHAREDDELRYEVGVRSVTGNSDRWTFKFRKPE